MAKYITINPQRKPTYFSRGSCQEYINGANRSFIKKWNADIRYIKNMEANGKGIRVFRFFILTLLGIFFVPYCYIKYKLN